VTGNLLTGSAQTIEFDAGEVAFRQQGLCKGLYVVVSGQFLRKADRMKTHLTLGSARPGDLVELAAALGGGEHTYTLAALTGGSLLMLPIEALHRPLRAIRPSECVCWRSSLAKFSRSYIACCLSRVVHTRRRSNGVEAA